MALSLCYLALCRFLGLLCSSHRAEIDKDIELMVLRHEVRILERQVHGRVPYRPADRALLAALSHLLPASAGGRSSSRPRPCCAGITSCRDASGDAGGDNAVLGGLPFLTRSSS